MNRILVTGATGFVGEWTLRHWRKAHPEVEIWATSNQPGCPAELANRFTVIDIRDADAIRDFVYKCRPDHVIHLASLVKEASLAEHLNVNVLGTENLYSCLTELGNYAEIRIIQAETAAMYGRVRPDELPISEKNPLRPLTAYAISKTTQDFLAEMFWKTRGLNVIRARIFNLVGPGQPGHLVPATFIRQLKDMSDGDSIQVGNLKTRRDFVDVRDVISAFDKLLPGGQAGEVYNIGSGVSVAIEDILNELLCISGLRGISIKQELGRTQRIDVPDVIADTSAIRQTVGWQPEVPLQQSLEDMWNEYVRVNAAHKRY